ncbi:SRPBCC domain-containing protein [Exilibacterium tricleocarpae]|uniref:SRPBCC domain-containing protein n=1 Tax=Exilibacterium tricleocarpae TaxID=2591008 RepID=A0A545U9G7_9GAMM|nr:SRPBCC domain-containing protein [Exilibacterium tricleocarpae]TQV86118.1 SRPBCC domain-containing protein [Exilibacterium tricleocarpae]
MSIGDNRVELSQLVEGIPEEVFDAWVTPELVEVWWGPEGYQTKVRRLEPRLHGNFVFDMTSPSGASCPMTGIYTEFDRPNKLSFKVFDHCSADVPDQIELPTKPSLVEVTFIGYGDKTELTLVQTGLNLDYQKLVRHGWTDSLNRLSLSKVSTGQMRGK